MKGFRRLNPIEQQRIQIDLMQLYNSGYNEESALKIVTRTRNVDLSRAVINHFYGIFFREEFGVMAQVLLREFCGSSGN